MIRVLRYFAILLLVPTAVLSCSKAAEAESMESDAALEGNKVLISGIVADEHGNPLEGISIHLLEYLDITDLASPVNSIKSTTDKDGYYSIYAEGDLSPMLCYVKAEDPNGIYMTQVKTVLVKWSGPTFDKDANMFVVNDCNFILLKRLLQHSF